MILRAVLLKMQVFWHVMLCRLERVTAVSKDHSALMIKVRESEDRIHDPSYKGT